MIRLLAETAPSGGGVNPVILATEIVLAIAAIVSAVTPIMLARRKARKEAEATAAKLAAKSGDLTLAGWQALNGALQEEIARLQGVQEKMQARIDQLEGEIDLLRQAMRDHNGSGHA